MDHVILQPITFLPDNKGFLTTYLTTRPYNQVDSAFEYQHFLLLNNAGQQTHDFVPDSFNNMSSQLHSYMGKYYFGTIRTHVNNGNFSFKQGLSKYDPTTKQIVLHQDFANQAINTCQYAFFKDRIFCGYNVSHDSSDIFLLDTNFNQLRKKRVRGAILGAILNNYTPQLVGIKLRSVHPINPLDVVMLDSSFNLLRELSIDSLGLDSLIVPGQTIKAWVNSMDPRIVGHDTNLTILSFSNKFSEKTGSIIKSRSKAVSVEIQHNIVKRITRAGQINRETLSSASKSIGHLVFHVGHEQGVNSPFFYPPKDSSRLILIKENLVTKQVDTTYYAEPDQAFWPASIDVTDDTSVVVSGTRYNYVNPNVPDVSEGFILHFNKNGQVLYTGIREQAKDDSFTLFPNPCSGATLNLKSATYPVQVNIYAMDGRRIESMLIIDKTQHLQVQDWPNGLYFVQCSNAQGTYTEKVVIQRD